MGAPIREVDHGTNRNVGDFNRTRKAEYVYDDGSYVHWLNESLGMVTPAFILKDCLLHGSSGASEINREYANPFLVHLVSQVVRDCLERVFCSCILANLKPVRDDSLTGIDKDNLPLCCNQFRQKQLGQDVRSADIDCVLPVKIGN